MRNPGTCARFGGALRNVKRHKRTNLLAGSTLDNTARQLHCLYRVTL